MRKCITIHKKIKAPISKEMTGLFFEDINYAADGGLYAELLENRAFEFVKASGHTGDYYTEFDGLYGWSALNSGEMLIVSGSPVAKENPHYLRFTAEAPGDGFTNKAYDGIYAKKGDKFTLSFYARNVGRLDHIEAGFLVADDCVANTSANNFPSASKSNASITDFQSGSCSLVSIKLDCPGEKELCSFKKYTVTLTSDDSLKGAKPVIFLPSRGTIEFDFFSLMPENAVAGIFRKDLFDLLKGIQPGFIRFPGGCIIEGNTLANRYNFKDTLKPLEHRKSNWNRWAVHGNDWREPKDHSEYDHYNQTYGIGYYEFFLLCEMLGAKPLPVLNVGLACQYQSYELVPIESEEFKDFLQDALDLISFANDPVDTAWGKVRASLGHPEPFNLEMVGIGNEQWETEKSEFFKRYTLFEKTIHDTYPDIKLIGSAGPDITSERYTAAWNFIRENASKKDNFVYAVDEHYYVRPQWLLDHVSFYDNYDRKIKVFAGEYAAHPEGSGTFNNYKVNTLEGALAEAAFLTGVERNADVVVLASYAPLFARLGYTQWSPDMIWFDAETAYGTPSYYVQLMYSRYTGSATLDTMGQHEVLYNEGLYYNPSIDENTGRIYVKIVNTNNEPVALSLNDESGSCLTPSEIVVLSGPSVTTCNPAGSLSGDTGNSFENPAATAYNSVENPENISLRTGDFDGDCITLEPNSFSIIIL